MPVFRTGNMWSAYESAGLFCITTNSAIRCDGALVMGRGIAREAAERFPGLSARLGRTILSRGTRLGRYDVVVDPQTRIAAFQVKYRWEDDASLDLIRTSAQALQRLIAGSSLQVHLNFPGIGNGRLTRAAVLPLLGELPGNVTIWERAPHATR